MSHIKCYKCGFEIPETQVVKIRGKANVEGTTSLRDFHDNGVVWTPGDSWEEEVKCPHCGRYFFPHFRTLIPPLLREEDDENR